MKIALCCIAKCENLYLSEWVNHHLNIGFDHIYIYDNNDTDGERCEDIVGKENPNVTVLKYFIGKKQKGCETQIAAYNDFYQRFGGKYDWVLYLDVDEFLVINDYANVCGYIKDIIKPSTKSVRLNWKCYDDNDNLHYECLPVRERFTRVCEDETLSYYKKHFYRTKLMEFKAINVHYSNIRGDVVDCDGKYATYSTFVTSNTYNHNKAYIAHYATKSADEYYMIKKKRRGDGIGNDRLSIEHYFKYNKRTEEKERYLTDLFSGKVKQVDFEESKVVVANEKPTEGISVCITAYNAQDFIEECLDSVAEQTWFKTHNNWEIIVGIDGCESTLLKMKEIMHKYKNLRVLMMDNNKGTYVTSNTIMKEAKYEWLLRFDSDDVMFSDMIENLLNYVTTDFSDILIPYSVNFGKQNNFIYDKHGCVLIRKEVFENFGGYRPWICSSDTELIVRLNNYVTCKKYKNVCFKHRIHKNNLTIKDNTCMKSHIREEYKKLIKIPKNKKESIIKYVVSTFKEIYCFNECNNINESVLLKVALHAIGKNENLYIREWVKWYKELGISKIFLYDNNDINGEHFEDVIQDYINDGFVELFNVRGKPKYQLNTIIDCYNNYRNEYDWFCFFDIDEFLLLNHDKNISQYLSRQIFSNFNSIAINWLNFNDNDLLGYENNYDRSVVNRFTKPAINNDLNKYNNGVYKKIIRGGLEQIVHIDSPHTFSPCFDKKVCNNKGLEIKGKHFKCDTDYTLAQLNHYCTKTILEFILKSKRGGGVNGINEQYSNINVFFNYNKETLEKKIIVNKYSLMDDELIFCVVNYNTPLFINYLIKSIDFHVKQPYKIYIFDNSDKYPYVNSNKENIIILDNTKGDIINFETWLKNFPNRFNCWAKNNNWGSAKHCYSVQKCMEIINKNFILLDSDILFKKDPSDIIDLNSFYCGEIITMKTQKLKRIAPFMCYINVTLCNLYGINYFYSHYMHGLEESAHDYDTGGAFYKFVKPYPHREITLSDYIIHYGQGSWIEVAGKTKYIDKHTQTPEEWIDEHKDLWSN